MTIGHVAKIKEMLTINAFIFDNIFAFNNADDAFAFDNTLYSIMRSMHSHLTMYLHSIMLTMHLHLTMNLSLRILSVLEFHNTGS